MNTPACPMSVQIIAKNGQPEWAVLPHAEYEALRVDLDDLVSA